MLKKYQTLLGITSLLLLSACSSKSTSHVYNDNFGVASNFEAETQLRVEKEFLTNVEQESMELEDDPREDGAFFAEDWVKPKDKITYKYLGDSRMYTEDELPENKGRLGNVVIKVPSNMEKEEFLTQLNDGHIPY